MRRGAAPFIALGLVGCLGKFPSPPSETQTARDASVLGPVDGNLDELHDAILVSIDTGVTTPDASVDAARDAIAADAAVPDATILDAAIAADSAVPDAAVLDAAIAADAAVPDATVLDDAIAVDAAVPDATIPDAVIAVDVATTDAAEPDSGAIIPDATPDAEIPPFISTTNVRVTDINSPSNEIDCYPNGEGPPSRVREGDTLVAAERLRVGESVMVTCLVPDPQNSMTIQHEDAGNCQVTATDGPLCDAAEPFQNGCVTIRGEVIEGDNVTTTPLQANATHQVVHPGQVSPFGHIAMVGVNCPAN